MKNKNRRTKRNKNRRTKRNKTFREFKKKNRKSRKMKILRGGSSLAAHDKQLIREARNQDAVLTQKRREQFHRDLWLKIKKEEDAAFKKTNSRSPNNSNEEGQIREQIKKRFEEELVAHRWLADQEAKLKLAAQVLLSGWPWDSPAPFWRRYQSPDQELVDVNGFAKDGNFDDFANYNKGAMTTNGIECNSLALFNMGIIGRQEVMDQCIAQQRNEFAGMFSYDTLRHFHKRYPGTSFYQKEYADWRAISNDTVGIRENKIYHVMYRGHCFNIFRMSAGVPGMQNVYIDCLQCRLSAGGTYQKEAFINNKDFTGFIPINRLENYLTSLRLEPADGESILIVKEDKS